MVKILNVKMLQQLFAEAPELSLSSAFCIGNNVSKFHVPMMKIVPVSFIYIRSLCVIRIMMNQHIVKGIISDNKLINLCEIWLFHIV